MLLYHGSNIEISTPKIMPSNRALDFGVAFYLTSDLDQAKNWALKKAKMNNTERGCVSVFEVDLNNIKSLNYIEFQQPNRDWLHYIVANRKRMLSSDDYDIVIGPVANDQTIRVVNEFLRGLHTEEITIQLLLTQRLKDQYAFKTKKALNILSFIEVFFYE